MCWTIDLQVEEDNVPGTLLVSFNCFAGLRFGQGVGLWCACWLGVVELVDHLDALTQLGRLVAWSTSWQCLQTATCVNTLMVVDTHLGGIWIESNFDRQQKNQQAFSTCPFDMKQEEMQDVAEPTGNEIVQESRRVKEERMGVLLLYSHSSMLTQ